MGANPLYEDQDCENQTLLHALMEKGPIFGEFMERNTGGPQNPAYYKYNDTPP